MLHVNLQKLHCTLFNQKERIPQRPHTVKCWDVLTGKIIICIIIIIFCNFSTPMSKQTKTWYTWVAETWPKGQNLFYYKNEIKKLPPISRYWFSNSLIWSSFFITKSLSPHDKQIIKVIDHFFSLFTASITVDAQHLSSGYMYEKQLTKQSF